MAEVTADGGTGGGQPSAPTARRMVLGAQLRRLRENAGISRADAGYRIRSSESKMSRIELGRVGFKERDVADLLEMYGITDEDERKIFLDMVKESNQPGWWQRFNDVIPSWFTDYVGLEESASRIQVYENQFVPGLLQTEDYARTVIRYAQPRPTEDEFDRRVALRMRRQKILTRPKAPQMWAVIDEAVLHRPVGGREVFRAQLDALLEFTSMPHISLQVVPYEHSGQAAEGAFTVLRFAESELPTIVYVEHLEGALYLDRPGEVEGYGRVLDQLAVDADTPEASRARISKRRAEL